MNLTEYKDEHEISKINSYILIKIGYLQQENYIDYINLYFNQPDKYDYLSKEACVLESYFYSNMENIDEIRRIHDYYFDTLIKDKDSNFSLSDLKIIFRYANIL